MKRIILVVVIIFSIILVGCNSKTDSLTKETFSFTEICNACESSTDCADACDSYCVYGGYDGSENPTGRINEKYLGLKNEVECTCNCYEYN